MQMNDLKPVSSLVQRYGVKSVLFGAPGCGKTPIAATAPRPVILVTEPGLLSMRGCNAPAWEAYDVKKIVEFFDWFFKSKDSSQFDTLVVDSFSNVAEIILKEEESKQKHGMKAYGEMARRVYDLANDLFYMKQKHIILIAKQGLVENGRQTIIQGGEIIYEPVMQKRPYFPGKDLNVKMPHLFDNVLHLADVQISGQPRPVKAFRTKESPEVFARSRSGNFNEFEPADMNALFSKAML